MKTPEQMARRHYYLSQAWADAEDIRATYFINQAPNGKNFSLRDLAKVYQVSEQTIATIINRESKS